jgi:hypothetical protein
MSTASEYFLSFFLNAPAEITLLPTDEAASRSRGSLRHAAYQVLLLTQYRSIFAEHDEIACSRSGK